MAPLLKGRCNHCGKRTIQYHNQKDGRKISWEVSWDFWYPDLRVSHPSMGTLCASCILELMAFMNRL